MCWYINSNTVVYGENEYMVNLSLVYFTLLKNLNDAFEVQFFRASFLRFTKDTDSI